MAAILDNLLGKLHKSDPERAHDLLWLLNRSTIVRVQNIADYLYGVSEQEIWERREHFPCIAPPWKTCWLEWRHPRYSRSGKEVVDRGFAPDIGVLCMAQDLLPHTVVNIDGTESV